MLFFIKKLLNAIKSEPVNFKKKGNDYLASGNIEQAEQCYRQHIIAHPDDSEGYANLAFLLLEKNQLEDAESCLNKAAKIDNVNPDIFYMLGKISHKKNNIKNAIYQFEMAAKLCSNRDLYLVLANSFFDLGKKDDGLNCLHKAHFLAPDDTTIKYLISAVEGYDRPDTAPTEYIQKLFDGYADSFEKSLVEELKYVAPKKLVALLNEEVNLSARKWTVLDLGCGTGLLGQEIAPYVDSLVGVDLSAKMLEKAGARHIYTRLENAELVSMMRTEQESSYDIAMAADVFIYVGKLDETFAEVSRVLKPHGIFLFSLEAWEEVLEADAHKNRQQDFRLNATMRYSHSAQYIEKLTQLNNFTIRKMIFGELRNNVGAPVSAWYVLCELIK